MRQTTFRFRLLRSAVALTFLAGASFAAAPLAASAGTASTATVYPTAQVGTADQVNSGSAPSRASGASPGAASERARGVRKPNAAAPAAARSSNQAASSDDQQEGQSDGRLLQHFNGVSSLDSELTNFGLRFEPPDQGLCAGNGFVMEPVNSAYTIYTTNGAPIAGPFNVNDLFHRDGLAFTTDPRCYYDAATNTWFAIIAFIADDNNSSTIDISVNNSGDPTKAWTTYRIDTTDGNDPARGCPCFGDQPRFGIDAYNLYLSSDEFSILGPEYNGAQLYAVAKSDLVRLKKHIHFAHYANPLVNGQQVFAVEPATTNGEADAEYFLAALDESLDGTTYNQISVWAMTNRDRVARGVAPTLSSTVISSEPYSVPPPAIQKGSSHPLDSGDDRMQQTQFINGTIWGELGTALKVQGDGKTRAAAAWFNVAPALSGGVLHAATMARQGYVALAGNYLLYPAIQADRFGNAAMVVSVSGANRFPSAAFTTMTAGRSKFGPIQIAAAGTGPYVPRPNQFGRWGDYSYASLDAATGSVWLATEYVPPVSSQTSDRKRNWGTEVMQVALGD